MVLNIRYDLKHSPQRRNEQFIPDKALPFGKLRTDHMFVMNYDGESWVNPRIVPYGDLSIPPGAVCLNYGQGIFEGAKAFKHPDEEMYTFRINENAKRMNISAEIMCIPQIPEEDQIEGIHSLIDVDRLWFPEKQNGASMYIRPLIVGTEDGLGVKPSKTYTFCVFLSPSGPYYAEGFTKPIKLLITKKYHRAVPGGSGSAKAAGNYGASLRVGRFAQSFGAAQTLYLDTTNTYIEEAGAMNHFHVTADGTIIIPEFTDTILESITAKSVLDLGEHLKVGARQERIALDDFVLKIKDMEIMEAGGLGTAAVVTAVGGYIFEDGRELQVGQGDIGEITRRIYETITGIQTGILNGPEGWMQRVERKSF